MRKLARNGHFLIARPDWPLTFAHASTLRDHLDALCDIEGVREIAIDLSKVTEIDPSGIGSLVAMSTIARAKGRKMYIFRPSAIVQQLLETLSIQGFFPLLENKESLLGHLPD